MRKQHITGMIAILLAILIPCGFFLGMIAPLPNTYSETFVAQLGEKFDRLCEIDEPKLILIGGSSVAFGFDSKTLTESLGMPVVNFGLYATLGTKLMLDLSRANIGEGDIIILSPELNAQTLSLYFNAESTWQAIEGRPNMLRYVGTDDLAAMAGAFYDYGITKFGYQRDGVKLSPTGVYRSDSFNEYGDIEYDRPHNTLYEATGLPYDTANTITLTSDIVSDDFIDYVNEYVAFCEGRGATVYFAFCPMNKAALTEGSGEESGVQLFDYFARTLDCKVITSPGEALYDAEYFYDTNFHLNNAGVSLHTKAVLDALYREMGRSDLSDVQVLKKPKLPSYDGMLSRNGNDYSHCFTYEAYGNGYCITGVTAAGKEAAYLEIPSIYKGRSVLAIGTGAFAGCTNLTELKIFKNINVFGEEIFKGYEGTLTVYMDVEDADYMTDPNASLPRVSTAMMENTKAKVKICFAQACFERYLQDYNWQQYGALFDVGTKESPAEN